MTPTELSAELQRAYNSSAYGDKTTAIHVFGIRHAAAIRNCGASVASIVRESGIRKSYVTEVHKGMALAAWVAERDAKLFDTNDALCANCVFWKQDDPGNRVGACRKHAPTPARSPEDRVRTSWPSTRCTDWCGDWRRR